MRVGLLDFARTAEAIGATSSTLEKARLLADYLRRLPPDDLRRAAIYMSGQPYGGAERARLNLGWATIGRVVERLSGRDSDELSALFLKHSDLGDGAREALEGRTEPRPTSLAEVAAALDEIRLARTAAAKQDLLAGLLGRLDPLEARYVVKVLSFELRIGLANGLVEAAIAQAFDVPAEAVRRVHMLTGDVGETAVRCRAGELDDTRITLFQPLRFMLATPVETPAEAFERMQTPVVWTEEKYDGVRCQLHRAAGRCELFSRELKETAGAFPEIVEAALPLAHELILDGEILAHRGDRVLPFSELQRRLGRKVVSSAVRDEASGRLLNVGKAYSGLTDAEIAEMTRFFLAHTLADHGRARLVEPSTVIEVAFDAIQLSARHRSGFALRFPRIVRLRPDKPASEIDTLARVEELYERHFGKTVPLTDVAEVSPAS